MRLIDADALMETLERGDWVHITDYNIAIYAVKDAPTVDAVTVVRCRDCKHGSLQSNETKRYHCLQHNAMMEAHYYCILGERPQYQNTVYKCSKCGNMWKFKYNFCPNCGADMRKDGHD